MRWLQLINNNWHLMAAINLDSLDTRSICSTYDSQSTESNIATK